MIYEEGRLLFKNGDVVFFSSGRPNFVRSVIRWFTRGKFYHVGIAFWAFTADGPARLMLAEAQPDGFRIINLRSYSGRDMEVMRCPVAWSRISNSVVGPAGGIKYSLVDLLLVGMHERFGMKIPENHDGTRGVCSVIVSRILQAGGETGLETMVSPMRLYQQMAVNNAVIFTIEKNTL